ncbi:uncharacterized protein LOC132199330 [Neocloeon triangulifer]|uniref:uncharacterized protein LOC132199330 n=1 Tax=Neocloeon triangulifer TaxID=2078957 RepID=UPI00286F0823|nr:uncharacterized protein LOC132199330 [Neocloeon triangulifer]
MKFTDTLNTHFVPQFAMAPKEFAALPRVSGASITIVQSNSSLCTCPLGRTYAEVVKLIPRISGLSSVPAKTPTAPASTMPFATSTDKKPPCKPPITPNFKFCNFSFTNNKVRLQPPRANLWRSKLFRQEQNNHWKNNKNKSKVLPIANYNWRTPSPVMETPAGICALQVVVSQVLETKLPKPQESPEHKTEKTALRESTKTFRIRCLSESSQASEDSIVTFDRCSGSYESEISSDEYEASEDEETTLSEGVEDCTTPENSSGSESETEDSDSDEDMDDGPVLQVGKCDKVHLPLEIEVPPPPRLRSQSQSSLTSDYDESDDDFIVFAQDSEEEEEEESEDEADNVQVTPVPHRRRHPERVKPAELKVRFADNDEICPLYDDDDCRKARVGEWEERARDSSRFRARIANCATIISPILTPEHRVKIQEKLKRLEENQSRDSHVNKKAAEKVPTSGVDRRRSVLVH